MSLSVAHQFRSDNRKVAHDNLEKVLEACKSKKPELDHLLTNVSADALKDYSNAQLGLVHSLKKYSASVFAYGATVALPVAGVVGGSYYLFQDYIYEPSKIPGDFYEMLKGAIPSVTEDFSNDPVGYYKNWLKAAAIGTVVADLTLQKASGQSLLKPIAAWSASMLSTAWLYASYKAGEMTSGSYTKVEQKALETSMAAKKCIFDQQMKAFNGDQQHFGISDELHEMYTESLDSPKDMFALKERAAVLDAGLPRLAKQLMKAPLTASEVAQTFDKLKSVIKSIREQGFELRKGGAEEDNKYNSELISVLSKQGIAGLGIPVKVQQHIDKAKMNTLGWGYTVGAIVDTAAKGSAVAVGAGLILPAVAYATSLRVTPGKYENIDYCISSSGDCLEAKLVAGASVAAGVLAGYKTAVKVYRHHQDDMKMAANAVTQHTERVEANFKDLYDGIADHLTAAAKDKKNLSEVKDQARAIKDNLPAIQSFMLKAEVTLDAEKILGKLRSSIANVEMVDK